MLEQWLKSQAIGLAGYAAGAFPQQIGLAATQRLCTLLDEWGWNNPRQMRSLPSSVLHVLTALDDNQILPPLKGRIQLAARTALEYLNPRQDAPLARSEILAHQIMYDSGSAKRITRLGISLTGRWGWPDLERGDLRPRLDDAVMRLRDPNGDTATRLNAIGDLQKLLLVGCPPAAMQVGNIL